MSEHLFQPGKQPKGGRPKGSKNKNTREVKDRALKIVNNYFKEYAQKDLDAMEAKERFASVTNLAKIVLPKETKSEVTNKTSELKTWVIQSAGQNFLKENETIDITPEPIKIKKEGENG